MEDFRKQKGSYHQFGTILYTSNLLVCRKIFFKLLFYLLVIGTTLLLSCKKESEPKDPIQRDTQVIDTVRFTLDIGVEGLKKLDLLIYEGSGLNSIIDHIELLNPYQNINLEFKVKSFSEAKPSGWSESTTRDFRIIAIGNYMSKIGTASVQRYEAATQLRADFRSDDPDFPISAAEAYFIWDRNSYSAGTVELTPIPLMSFIELSSISNTLDDYELLEEPRVRLRSINASAALLQKEKFYPSEAIEYGEWEDLEFDVGFYTQYPEIRLACYPNSDKSSPVRTELEFECKIKGKTCSFLVEIPSLERNTIMAVDLVVENQYSYESEIHKIE